MERLITTLAMTLGGLTDERRKAFANQKQKEIHDFDSQNLNGLKTSEDQTKVLSKETENSKREVANLKKQNVDLASRVKKNREEIETLSKILDEMVSSLSSLNSRLDSLKEAVANRINQLKEMKEFHENRNSTEINEVNKRVHQDIITPETKNDVMKNDLKECEETVELLNKNDCQSYIGEVCLNLQANMYYIVLPEQFAGGLVYKIKVIEQDIEDEDLLNDEEREKARERWEDLKKKLDWNPSLERTLKMLQKERNPMERPHLTVEEAERAAEELDKQGRLRGRTSYEKVRKIINMWRISATLVQSLP